ncbi:beta-1,3-galactosyltransferase 5-like [Paramacrobiotus metropolitanus]|uniref:beta-1,3-galactosyltransferase 5-like n=1 Tax=Paramacrobiotus metropolitanus TaxID=2943436 RepID=UPI0024462296|nr:beta-1,3-galactosyltransferase 5-like [Paramacrobiotus metropolitanus]
MHHEQAVSKSSLPEWRHRHIRSLDYRYGFAVLLVAGMVLLPVIFYMAPVVRVNKFALSVPFIRNLTISGMTALLHSVPTERVYPIQPFNICRKGGRHPHLVLFVPSRPGNSMDRNALRETWGMHARLCDVRIIFGFGRFESTEIQHEAHIENSIHGDLLQIGHVFDHYHNQTQLVLAFLEWGAANCQSAKFIGKADEDTWINVHEVLKHLEMPEAPYSVIGHFAIDEPVLRKPEQKWYLTKEEFPNATYPPFPYGQLYIFPTDLLPRVLATARSGVLRMHWLDDVYIGGQIPELLHMSRLHIKARAQLYNAEKLNCTNPPMPVEHAQKFNCKCVGRDWVILHATSAVAKRRIFFDPCMAIYRQYNCPISR